MNTLFGFLLILVIMSIGFGFMFGGPAGAKAVCRSIFNQTRKWLGRFLRWAWHNYRREIVGAGIMFALLALTGHLK